jgi:tryptophan 2,3-dioxygenase
VATEDFSEPILTGRGANDYERYLRTEELLLLQKEPDEMVHRDELLFQTVHKSSELWLKLCAFEVETATELIGEADFAAAIRLLRRAVDCLKLVTSALDMLEHLSPWEYQEIRRVLGHGSGFDSPGWARLRKAAPALGESWHKHRRAAGLSIVELYQRGREFEDLYQLAELLIELDERASMWRLRHFKVVERVIGGEVVGTQGTPVEMLGKLVSKNLYPELWRARTDITNAAKEFD